jgi:hypothetical protein
MNPPHARRVLYIIFTTITIKKVNTPKPNLHHQTTSKKQNV